jgi:phosphatidylserine/phosphatidylglycerophosphate/cardiolipin synthase-like enzyme
MEEAKTTIIIGKEYAQLVIPLIKNSKKSIKIIVYNWLWYPTETGSKIQNFNNAIIQAHKKGVEVKVVVQKMQIAEILRQEKIKVRRIESSKVLHIKLMLIDEKIAIIGSHNYTMNAFNINYEISAIIQEAAAVKKLNDYFQNFFY